MEQNAALRQCPPVYGADALYQTYADMVYRLALLRTKSRADAEDVTQEVFVRCIRSAPAFTDAEHQKAWLIRVTINCSKSLLTSAWKRHSAPDAPSDELCAAPEAEDLSDVYAAVLALPPKHRTAVHLYYYEGYSVREIAEMTNASESAVKSLLFRAREQLRAELKGEYRNV